MEYKGFTIIHSSVRGWIVKVDSRTEYLAQDEQDAKNIVDGLRKFFGLDSY